MNTLRLRTIAETYGATADAAMLPKLASLAVANSTDALFSAADCIDELRDHCRQQRKELRRLNEALQRRPRTDYIGRGAWLRIEAALHRTCTIESAVNSIARFVGCAKEAQ